MNKLGLVFAGGGGKGAYQIGVWDALRKYGIDRNISAIAGNSVGGLNAALFMAGSYETAEKIWRNIHPDQILHINFARIVQAFLAQTLSKISPAVISAILPALLAHGIFSREGLLEVLDSEADLLGVSASGIAGYVTCCPLDDLSSVEYIKLNGLEPGLIKKYLLATSAIPGVFAAEWINNKCYVDGGTHGFINLTCGKDGADNFPIRPLLNEGCNYVIVVHLSAASMIQRECFPGVEILEIFPSKNLGGFMDGTLDFSAEGARRRMLLGYHDTIRVMEPFYETIKTLQALHWSTGQISAELAESVAETEGYLEESRAAVQRTLRNLAQIGSDRDVKG